MIDELRKRIKSDPETKDLELTDHDVYEVCRYLDVKNSNSMPGYIPKLILTPFIHYIYVPTKQKHLELANKKLSEYLETFESEIFIQNIDLSSYKPRNEKQEKALSSIVEFINHDFKYYMKGAYLYGPYKAGKSYLLSALANELSKLRKTVIFTYVPDLARSLKNAINNNTLEHKINLLKRCDCLILDDLGGQNISSWFRDEILLSILQYRLSASLPVFISSNYNLKQLAESLIYDINDKDEKRKVGRFIERIRDLCKIYDLGE